MSLNNSEINLVLSELDLSNCLVQGIIQPDFSSLVFLLYKPGKSTALYISLKQGKTRINYTETKYPKSVKVQRFVQFLKSKFLDSRITGISQPGNDRIVKIETLKDNRLSVIWIRLWSSNANVIVTDQDGTILDTYYRKPGRQEISGGTFKMPPAKESAEYLVRLFESSTASFNSYIDNFYRDLESKEVKERLSEQVSSGINKQISYLKSALPEIDEKIRALDNYENLMNCGRLILGSCSIINKGQKWLETEDICCGCRKTSRIKLDEKLTPEQNAEKYFNEYKKSKKTLTDLTEEKTRINAKIAVLEESLESCMADDNIENLKKTAGKNNNRKALNKAENKNGKTPGLQLESGNYRILVGRNSKENDELLRKYVKGSDIWFHSRDYPGGYVFIKAVKNKTIPLDILLQAGSLAIHFSKTRNSGKGEVYYTQVKYLRRIKEGKTGKVIPTREKNLSITVDENKLRKILSGM